MKMKKNTIIYILIAAVFSLSASSASYYLQNARINKEISKIAELQKQIAELQKQQENLQENINQQTNQIKTAIDKTNNQVSTLAETEIKNRQNVRAASEEDLLTAAVAKAAPAVVSIVISKDVPQLEVTYENPFGDDPFFKDFNIRIPVYRQKGTVKKKIGAGSGFLVSANGYIVTNRHVVSDTSASYTVLLSNGAQMTATVVWRDSNHDVAIIKIEGSGYPTIALGDSDSLKLGQRVVAIGNALGEYSNSVSVGSISGLNRTITASDELGNVEKLTGVIQTDAAINPGNSGGPLIDLNGNVVGVNVATIQGSNNISFAIPINSIKSVIRSNIR